MQRAMTAGGAGSGKSTLARWLAEQTGLPAGIWIRCTGCRIGRRVRAKSVWKWSARLKKKRARLSREAFLPAPDTDDAG